MASPESFAKTLQACLEIQNDLIPEDSQLTNATANSRAKGIAPIAIGSAQGQFLSILCKMVNAKHILELGVLGGYSTIWLAKSVPGVKVTALEFSEKNRNVALENLKGMDNVDIRLGAALDILPELEKEGCVFDFFFIDADWVNQGNYFDWAVRLARKGSVIYVDNVLRQVVEGEEEGVSNSKALMEHAKKHSNVQTTFMPTVSTDKSIFSRSFDGFTLSIVN